MKKLCALIAAVLMLAMVLSACGKSVKLEGTYSADYLAAELRYSFDKDESVKAKIIVLGFVAWEGEGTYAVSEEGDTIELSFSGAAEAEDALPGMDDVLNGSFTFSQDEDSIFIGNLQYSKVS
jgi:hypothetical protein